MNPQGYTNERMNLQDVCAWLTGRDMAAEAFLILDAFQDHVWTEDGMTRTDVLKEVFSKIDETGLLFREMECDVITYMSFIPDLVAHVD
jgi:uncharacterized protein CbrC (UPF0167 family)